MSWTKAPLGERRAYRNCCPASESASNCSLGMQQIGALSLARPDRSVPYRGRANDGTIHIDPSRQGIGDRGLILGESLREFLNLRVCGIGNCQTACRSQKIAVGIVLATNCAMSSEREEPKSRSRRGRSGRGWSRRSPSERRRIAAATAASA